MKRIKSMLLAAAALSFVVSAPVLAQNNQGGGGNQGNSGNQGNQGNQGGNGNQGRGVGAPGPLAAVGLPFLLVAGVAGAYRLARRRQEESRRQDRGADVV